MRANTLSLLTSKWLINDNYANSMIPQLVRLLQGKDPIEVKTVNPTFANTKMDYWDDEDWDDEDWNDEDSDEKYTAILPIKGVITKYSQFCGPMGTQEMRRRMESWKDDKRISAVVLDIDSGGGQWDGTAEFADYIRNYPKKKIAFSDGYICSAAYFIAAGCDEIWVNQYPGAVGSIGTMSKFINLEGVIQKKGGEIIEEYATKSPKKNNVWREIKKGNVKPLIAEVLDPINEIFLSKMKEFRPQLSEEALDGSDYFDTEKLLELGLIDKVGSKEEAIQRAFDLSNEALKPENFNLNTDMSKENSFPKLAAVLGIEDVEAKKSHLFAADKTVSLNEEQLSQIEAALTDPGDGQKLADLQTALDAEKTAKQAADAKVTEMENAVDAALTKVGLESTGTKVEDINLMADTLVEYGKKPGANPTEVHSDGDPVNTKPETTAIFDSLVK